MHKCFSYPLKAGNKEHILWELCPVVSSPAAVQRSATLRSPAPLLASCVRRWDSASPRDRSISYLPLHIPVWFSRVETEQVGREGMWQHCHLD